MRQHLFQLPKKKVEMSKWRIKEAVVDSATSSVNVPLDPSLRWGDGVWLEGGPTTLFCHSCEGRNPGCFSQSLDVALDPSLRQG